MNINLNPTATLLPAPLQQHGTPARAEELSTTLALLSPSYYLTQPMGWIHPSPLPIHSLSNGITKAAAQMNWRKGKWFEEEEAYTKKLIEAFNGGHLPLPSGTTLRSFLSEKLNCDPMRITKKFAGSSCIGKQVFTPCSSSADPVTVKKLHDELAILEEKFQEKVESQRALELCPLTPQTYFAALQQYQLSALMRDNALQQEYLAAVAAQQIYYQALMKSYIAEETGAASPMKFQQSTAEHEGTADVPTIVGMSRDLTDVCQPLPTSCATQCRISPSCNLNLPNQNYDSLAPKGTVLSVQLKTNLTVGTPFDPLHDVVPNSCRKAKSAKRSHGENKMKKPNSMKCEDGEDIAASDLLLNFFNTAKTRDANSRASENDTVLQSEPSTDGEEQLSVTDDSYAGLSRSNSIQSLSALEDSKTYASSKRFRSE